METIEKAGVPDAKQYIRFYNLRNFDRINVGQTIQKVEQQSGVQYRDARMQHDDIVGAGYDGKGYGTGAAPGQAKEYDAYQQAASQVLDGSKYDSVATSYMDGGTAINDIPWAGTDEEEMNAFVSEGTSSPSSLFQSC
jgi:phospholipase D1/2